MIGALLQSLPSLLRKVPSRDMGQVLSHDGTRNRKELLACIRKENYVQSILSPYTGLLEKVVSCTLSTDVFQHTGCGGPWS